MFDDERRILIFGGTFDPPHLAHVVLPAHVAAAMACNRILFVPAARNPLKATVPPSADVHRVAMLELALHDLPGAEISMLELDRGGPSWFVETLKALRAELGPGPRLFFLIGADQALDFHRWHAWREILERADALVVLRPPWSPETFAAALAERYDGEEAGRWRDRVVPAPMMDVSATQVRGRLAAGEPTDGLLDPRVRAYALEHGLYAD